MNKFFKFEPVATLAAAQVLVQSIIILVTTTQGVDKDTFMLIEGVNTGFFAFLATFVRNAVTPTAALDALKSLTPEQLDWLKQQR